MIKHWLIAAAALATATPALAQVSDPSGDWLPKYGGAHNGDLDILSASASFDGTGFDLGAVLNGTVGSSAGALYVWGINRGAGTARLGVLGAPPPIGPDKLFDALAVLFPNGTGRIVAFPTMGPPVITPLAGISAAGNGISVFVPLALLPSTGFAAEDYTFTLWSRLRANPAMDGNNTEVADFGPDRGSFKASVPEPASWAMLILGFGATGAAMRRRRAEGALA